MSYAVQKIVNGNFSIDSEFGDNLKGAIMQWHAVCRAMWNDSTVEYAYASIINQSGRVVEGYNEYIHPLETA